MEELMQVRRKPNSAASSLNSIPSSDNWFLGTQAEKVYNTYLELDADENGTLSEDELYHFGGMNPSDSLRLTRTAIRRLLEETVTYSPVELDFKGFLDLVLALRNKATAQSITYFWKIINVDKSGRLSEQNIHYFYKEIFSSLKEHGCDAPDVKNVVVEIFDILACQDPRGPTLKDVIKSGQGHVVMSMLLDVTGFWQYDNRESLIGQQQQQQHGGSN
jgi:serine/threonine-protein phosphatase 2A regulatory subunit B''